MERRTSSPAAARPSTPLASSARRDVRCHRDDHRTVRERSKSTASTRGSVLAECRAHQGPAQESAAPRGTVRFLQAGLGSHDSLPAAVPRSCSTGPRGAGRSDTRRDRLTCACRSAGDGSGPGFVICSALRAACPRCCPVSTPGPDTGRARKLQLSRHVAPFWHTHRGQKRETLKPRRAGNAREPAFW